MKFLILRTKFLNKFLKDGKKYNSINIFNNINYYLTLKNKNNYKILINFFYIIEPLFFIEKKVYMAQLTKFVSFLPENRKIRVILNILSNSIKETKLSKVNNYSFYLSQELYNSLFRSSSTYTMCKSLNENFLKLRNDSHYKWF